MKRSSRSKLNWDRGPASEMTRHAAGRLLAGVPPKALASELGVSVRTAYRWRQGLVAVEDVTVAGYRATFARFERRQPIRISAWERAA